MTSETRLTCHSIASINSFFRPYGSRKWAFYRTNHYTDHNTILTVKMTYKRVGKYTIGPQPKSRTSNLKVTATPLLPLRLRPPCRSALHECGRFCSSNATTKSPFSTRGHHRRKRPSHIIITSRWHNPSYRRRTLCPTCLRRTTSFAMAHTRILPLLRYLRYRSPMDDLCASATQFQCVLLFLCFREHFGLIRFRFFSFYPEIHPNYALYRHRLANGWFPGTEIVSFVP